MAKSTGEASAALTDEQKKILEAFKSCEKPVGAKDIAEATGIDKKVVSNNITKLKKQNMVDSPVRCKYGITGDGINALG